MMTLNELLFKLNQYSKQKYSGVVQSRVEGGPKVADYFFLKY